MKNRTKILFSALTALFFVPFSTFAACLQDEQQIEFLYSNTGNDINSAGAILDSYPITAGKLAIGDTLWIQINHLAGSGLGNLTLWNTTNNLQLTPNITTCATASCIGQAWITTRGSSDTSISGVSLIGTVDTKTNWAISWNGAWTLGLRDSTTTGANNNWQWSVYKINGTAKCVTTSGSAGGATSSATDTASFADLNAEGRTLNYIAILALALAAFNSAAFWAWRIVKGTKKEI